MTESERLPSNKCGDLRVVRVTEVEPGFDRNRMRPLFDRYDIVDPKIVASGGTALLTYHLVTQNGALTRRWHATEVYQHRREGWRIIHSHFSAAKP